MRVERFVPAPLKGPYRRLKSALNNAEFGRRNTEIFDEIYRRQCWGSPHHDTGLYSGPGTYDPAVPEYLDYLLTFIREYKIRSIVEIGCGDFAIGRCYADKVNSYVGVDASSLVVERNRESYETRGISFVHGDGGELEIAAADLCIIRQVLQHLDNDSIESILRRTAVHRYVLVTEHLPAPGQLESPNLNKRSGPDTRLIFGSGVYVELPPFNRKGETVLNLPVEVAQAHPGEVMRTTLIVNR